MARLMAPVAANSDVSFSLIKLQRLRDSFDELEEGRPRRSAHARTVLRLAAQLGSTAIPTCARQLASSDDDRASWAYTLLIHTAADESIRPRVLEAARSVITDPATGDRVKMRALALLTELGAEVPPKLPLRDPNAAREQSLRELSGYLSTPAAVARAVDSLIDQLDDGDLLDFVDDLVGADPTSARTLLEELLIRDDVAPRTRRQLLRMRAATPQARPHRTRHRTRLRLQLRFGRRDDGRSVLIGWQRCAASRPVRWRALCGLIGEDGALLAADYGEDLTLGAIDREILGPLVEEGFILEDIELEEARDLLAASAQQNHANAERIPPAYYLGRDLLGLRDEHLANSDSEDEDPAALLSRAIDLMAQGAYDRARSLLVRYVARRPDDPEGCANLGLCSLHLGDPRAAERHLSRAAWLSPEQAIHHWNLAAAAHLEGRRGSCYLALVEYLARADDDGASASRRRVAKEFVAEYRRLAMLAHPELDPAQVARAEIASAVFDGAPRGLRKHSRL